MSRDPRSAALIAARKYRADVLVLIAYLLLAILLTFPLVLHFTTHVAGDGSDDPALAWNLWWVPYAVLHLDASPIYTNFMFCPIGLNLAYYTLTYLNAFLAIPLQFPFSLVVAANVNLLLSFALAGFGTYLLAQYLLRQSGMDGQSFPIVFLAAFAAGALYAFSSNKMLYAALGQFNIASSQWIPFYVLFLLKLTGPPRPAPSVRHPVRLGVLLGLWLLFQALSEFIFASFLIILTLLYLVYWALAVQARDRLATTARGLAAAGLVFLLPMLPILAAMVQDMLAEGDFIQSGLGFADVFSADLFGFFVPSHLHPLLGGLEARFHFAYTNFAFLGFSALALAVVAVWKLRPARLWAGLGTVFLLLALGPELRLDGMAVPAPLLPFNLLLQIPLVKGNRYPSRWTVMVTLCLALLVGYGLAWLLRAAVKEQPPPRRRAALLAIFAPVLALLLFEHLAAGNLPLSDFRIPAVYRTLAADPRDFSVLEIPLAWRNGFRMTGTIDQAMMFEQWYQTGHRHPILGGNTSRNPELKFQYFTEAPVLNSLIAVETGHTLDPAVQRADRSLAPAVLEFFGIRYVVWHSPRDPQNRAALEAARAYVEQVLPVTKFDDAVDETGETIAYRVNLGEPKEAPAIRADSPLARLYFAEGWGVINGRPVWATRPQARAFLPMRDPVPRTRLDLRAFSPLPRQVLRLSINGRAAGQIEMQPGWGEYRLGLPENIWRPGMNELIFQFEQLGPVAGVREADFAVGQTGVTVPVSLVVASAGDEVGDFAHVYVDGQPVSPNQVGYNLVVVDPASGAVESRAAFNTFASESESARLAQFIAQIPEGKVVAVAVRDEASRYLTSEAVDALRSIGARQDLRNKFRWSHAIVGVKGAPPGTALESAFETRPAELVVGLAATEPNVAAAVDWVQVTPGESIPSSR